MDWWNGFSAWAITTGLALIAAFVSIAPKLRYQRARPVVHPVIRPTGLITEERDGVVERRWGRLILTNQGTTNLRLVNLALSPTDLSGTRGARGRGPNNRTAAKSALLVR